MEQQPPPPASARVPVELRLEIWRHYFTDMPVTYISPAGLPSHQSHAISQWNEEVHSVKDATRHFSWWGKEVYTLPPAQCLRAEPALLQTCPRFREEALPFYLEHLQRKAVEECAISSDSMTDLEFWGVMCRQ